MIPGNLPDNPSLQDRLCATYHRIGGHISSITAIFLRLFASDRVMAVWGQITTAWHAYWQGNAEQKVENLTVEVQELRLQLQKAAAASASSSETLLRCQYLELEVLRLNESLENLQRENRAATATFSLQNGSAFSMLQQSINNLTNAPVARESDRPLLLGAANILTLYLTTLTKQN